MKTGASMGHKKQHFVPRSYLRAWHDETAPLGPKHTPYVWCFDRDGGNPKKKAPGNLFTETDIYTVPLDDGTRDLKLEHGFCGLEDKFARLRAHSLNGRQWPKPDGLIHLLAFAAISRFRTPMFRDAQRAQWGGIYAHMEHVRASAEAATPERRAAMAAMPRLGSDGPGLNMAQVARIRDFPIQVGAASMLKGMLDRFMVMSVAILCTDDPVGFVTSDAPCVWVDPAAHERPFMLQGVGLQWPTVEVTMPISPAQCLLITHDNDFQGFLDISQEGLTALNYRHIRECNGTFVARRRELPSKWLGR